MSPELKEAFLSHDIVLVCTEIDAEERPVWASHVKAHWFGAGRVLSVELYRGLNRDDATNAAVAEISRRARVRLAEQGSASAEPSSPEPSP